MSGSTSTERARDKRGTSFQGPDFFDFGDFRRFRTGSNPVCPAISVVGAERLDGDDGAADQFSAARSDHIKADRSEMRGHSVRIDHVEPVGMILAMVGLKSLVVGVRRIVEILVD